MATAESRGAVPYKLPTARFPLFGVIGSTRPISERATFAAPPHTRVDVQRVFDVCNLSRRDRAEIDITGKTPRYVTRDPDVAATDLPFWPEVFASTSAHYAKDGATSFATQFKLTRDAKGRIKTSMTTLQEAFVFVAYTVATAGDVPEVDTLLRNAGFSRIEHVVFHIGESLSEQSGVARLRISAYDELPALSARTQLFYNLRQLSA
jgi:hypothetical protein